MGAQQHEHYDHYNEKMIDRLDGFYGTVDDQLNQAISNEVVGSRVLDVGCGFGSLVEHCRKKGLQVTGIDMLEFCIAAGKKRYPLADIQYVASEGLPFPDQSFDTVILKETLHHVHGESDSKTFFEELKRVCKGRVIIVDPNPTWILLLSRKIIGHVDPVCDHFEAISLVEKAGFKLVRLAFSNIVSLPLSGGYVGYVLVPHIKFIYILVMKLDGFLSRLFGFLKVSHWFSWRYMVVAERVAPIKIVSSENKQQV